MYQDLRFSPGDAVSVEPGYAREQVSRVQQCLRGKGEVVSLTISAKGVHVSVKFGDYRTILPQQALLGA